jgi:hypothetical protein
MNLDARSAVTVGFTDIVDLPNAHTFRRGPLYIQNVCHRKRVREHRR